MSAARSGRNSGPGAPGQHDPAALVEDINRTRANLTGPAKQVAGTAQQARQAAPGPVRGGYRRGRGDAGRLARDPRRR